MVFLGGLVERVGLLCWSSFYDGGGGSVVFWIRSFLDGFGQISGFYFSAVFVVVFVQLRRCRKEAKITL